MMAKASARGGNRVGNVRGRSQVKDPVTGLWTKRPYETPGRFLKAKENGGSFKGIQEKSWWRKLLEAFGL